mmetsp:Transcript_51653/g.148982  ORF Transcript_51653/g.148982 Transcript_51653/m.148982 type:complete len:98 (-) Transcript_51653:35-328(-)
MRPVIGLTSCVPQNSGRDGSTRQGGSWAEPQHSDFSAARRRQQWTKADAQEHDPRHSNSKQPLSVEPSENNRSSNQKSNPTAAAEESQRWRCARKRK